MPADDQKDASIFPSSLEASNLDRIARAFEKGVKVANRKYHFRTYKNCFVGREAVDFLVRNNLAESREQAVEVGLSLARELNLFEHVCRQHDFKDEYLFYRFVPKGRRFVSIQDAVGCSILQLFSDVDEDSDSQDSLASLSSALESDVSVTRDWDQFAKDFERGIETKDQRYHLKTYKNVFVGTDAVDFMLVSGMARSRQNAVELGRTLTREYNLFRHVSRQHEFYDDFLFYEFTPLEERFTKADEAKKSEYVDLSSAAEIFEKNVPVRDRMYRFKMYRGTFVGSQAVDCLLKLNLATSRRGAVRLGRKLMHRFNMFEHVSREHDFQDDYYFYRFIPEDHRVGEDDKPSGTEEPLTDSSSHSSIGKGASFPSLLQVANSFRRGVVVGDHRWRLKAYPNTFVASEAVDFLVNSSFAQSRREAVVLGRKLAAKFQLFEHVTSDHEFKDDYLFFQFTKQVQGDKGEDATRQEYDFTTETLEEIAETFRANVHVKDRRYRFKTYKSTFVGREAVDFLVREGLAETRDYAVELGRRLAVEFNLFEHVANEHEFKDDYLFYRFVNLGELMSSPLYAESASTTELDRKELREIAQAFEKGIRLSDHREHLCVYKNSFVGTEAVDFLVNFDPTRSREEALQIGQALSQSFNLFEHVRGKHIFGDGNLCFRFTPQSERYSFNSEAGGDETSVDEHLQQETAPWDDLHMPVGSRETGLQRVRLQRCFSMPPTAAREFDNRVRRQASQRLKVWSSTFRRADPRYQILRALNAVAQDQVYDFKDCIDRDLLSDLLEGNKLAPEAFSVWRPTSYDAIRRMMLNEGTGKGLDIKGKSAKRGKMSGFVPFLQISENRHKFKIRTLPKDGRVRLFFKDKMSREVACAQLEIIAQDMIDTVRQAREVLAKETAETKSHKYAVKSMLLDVTDPSIIYIEEYAPRCYGLDVPIRLFWEAFFIRQDCTRKPGSEFDIGRPSIPAFQDMNFASLRGNAVKDESDPKVVVLQCSANNAMSPFDLALAYEENGMVLPVVSDFDCFLVGTRNVKYSSPLPPEQLDVLRWCMDRIEDILSNPGPKNWNTRWLEVLRDCTDKGFHPHIPPLGFGDPMSYSTMEDAIKRLVGAGGAVRHGAECFNYYFPQELDEEYLVITDALPGNLSWKYVNAEGLRAFLHDRIDEGFTFPLNPKHLLCDGGFKALYDKLLVSDNQEVQKSIEVWFPSASGLRERIEDIYRRYPAGFERRSVADHPTAGTVDSSVQIESAASAVRVVS